MGNSTSSSKYNTEPGPTGLLQKIDNYLYDPAAARADNTSYKKHADATAHEVDKAGQRIYQTAADEARHLEGKAKGLYNSAMDQASQAAADVSKRFRDGKQ